MNDKKLFIIDEKAILKNARPGRNEYNLLRWVSHQFDGSIFFDTGTLFGESARALCDNPTNLILTYDILAPCNYGKHINADVSVLPNMLPKIGDCKKINIEWISKIDVIYLDIDHTDGSHDIFVERIEPYFKGILIMDAIDSGSVWVSLSHSFQNVLSRLNRLPPAIASMIRIPLK